MSTQGLTTVAEGSRGCGRNVTTAAPLVVAALAAAAIASGCSPHDQASSSGAANTAGVEAPGWAINERVDPMDDITTYDITQSSLDPNLALVVRLDSKESRRGRRERNQHMTLTTDPSPRSQYGSITLRVDGGEAITINHSGKREWVAKCCLLEDMCSGKSLLVQSEGLLAEYSLEGFCQSLRAVKDKAGTLLCFNKRRSWEEFSP